MAAHAPRLFDRPLAGHARSTVEVVVFGVIPFVVLALFAVSLVHAARTGVIGAKGELSFDFEANLLRAGRDVLAGRSPYHLDELERVVSAQRAGHPPAEFATPNYPAPGLLLGVPFALLPRAAACIAGTTLLLLAIPLALRLCGVRDWRCYGVAMLAAPVMSGLAAGNLTALLVLLTAVAWRYRDRTLPCALAIATAISLKLFLWPLVLWLLATRRLLPAALSLVVALSMIVIGFAIVGPSELRTYPHLVSLLEEATSERGLSVAATGHWLGSSHALGTAVAVALGGLLLTLMLQASRTRRSDAASYGYAIAATLAFSPVIWDHYLSFALIAVALRAPTLNPLWGGLLIVYYLVPTNQTAAPHWWAVIGPITILAIAAIAHTLRKGEARVASRAGPSPRPHSVESL